MIVCDGKAPRPILLMVAGAKGAVASTVAAAVELLRTHPETVGPSLTTAGRFPVLGPLEQLRFCGWDPTPTRMTQALAGHGVVPRSLWADRVQALDALTIYPPPPPELSLEKAIDRLTEDIRSLRALHPGALPVFIDLLPACETFDAGRCRSFTDLAGSAATGCMPDLAYGLAAIRSGIPVVNFTPNALEIPLVCDEALACGVPVCGRDGKTGQTYFKVVLASALKARNLLVDGWYSLNILGNADGQNLMNPARAAGKLDNKTRILDDVLGYRVGEAYGESTHKVRIDYYPPRGDAKEAWDVIDIRGLFGLPMSLRVNLQGRDSILAAPLAMDLARWMTVLHLAGHAGPVPELGFFFKKPVGTHPPLSFQEQVARLEALEADCNRKISAMTAETENR